MRKGFLIAASFFLLFVFAGGMLVLLGAQDRDAPRLPPAGSGEGQPQAAPSLLDPGARTSSFSIEQILETPSGLLYALSKQRGFLVSFDGGVTWQERNQGLPRRQVYPFDSPSRRVRLLTSLNSDPVHEGRVAVTTASELYLSEDFGSSWQRIPVGKPLRTTSYLTAVALSPADPDTLLLGTSFNGFFETRDRGASWQDPSLGARFLYRGAGFYEEISGLSYHPESPGVIFFSCGFGYGVYEGSADRKSWRRLDFPGDTRSEKVRRLELRRSLGGWLLEVRTHENRWLYDLAQRSWQLASGSPPGAAGDPSSAEREDPFREERIRKASKRFGIYVSSFRAQGEDLDNHLRFIRDHGLNSLVVDCKDDFGWITYDTELEFPGKIGAVSRRFSLEELLSKAHAQGIYVIARVVVFKDQRLYNHNNYEHALWNATTGQPWRHLVKVEVAAEKGNAGRAGAAGGSGAPSGSEAPTAAAGGTNGKDKAPPGSTAPGPAAAPGTPPPAAAAVAPPPAAAPKYVQNEYWVDPYDPFVWSYNRSIAEELQRRGVDEIQFDYIRFPSDGNLSQIHYRFRPEGMTPIDALESFLTRVREVVHIPISTDLYGFNSWHRMGNWIGQSIEVLADYVDVICPMFYPSHFPRDFLKEEPYLERARRIYFEGTSRAAFMVGSRSIIRPYVQAFLIGEELAMGPAEYGLYLRNQIEGTLAAPSSGFTLWNASNRYYMVTRPLAPYLSRP